ncbi:hypothetical protein HZP54_16900 [Elizabethkingia anophelis]|nr:hypothetical protein [Elizabethkingia anophelis]
MEEIKSQLSVDKYNDEKHFEWLRVYFDGATTEFKHLSQTTNIARDHVIEAWKVAAIFGRPKRPPIPPNVHKLTYQRKRQ